MPIYFHEAPPIEECNELTCKNKQQHYFAENEVTVMLGITVAFGFLLGYLVAIM